MLVQCEFLQVPTPLKHGQKGGISPTGSTEGNGYRLPPGLPLGSNSVLASRLTGKKRFQPSGCVMFLREALLLSKFLSKENKILTRLSPRLLTVRKGGWGFVEREKNQQDR